MKQARWFYALVLTTITPMVGAVLTAQPADTAGIQQKLNTQFKLTTITADRSDIATAGDVAAIHKPGLIMYATASPMPPSNTYKNGRIGQGWGGFGKDLVISMLTPGGGTATDYPHRPFAPEEKCWVTAIQVQRDGVLFQLYSDPYDGIRYYANLKISFPNKKEVPSADTAMQLVAEVLTVAPQDQGDQSEQPAAAVAATPNPAQGGPAPPIAGQYASPGGSRLLLLPDNTFTKFVGGGQGQGQYAVNGDNLTLTFASTGFAQHFKIQGENFVDVNTQQEWARTADAPGSAPELSAASSAPPAPMPAIAPPPPPPDAPPPAPPTIAIGQTMDQVSTAFGAPLKVARLGAMVIFYYKDMKVTFRDGKVSNVE